MENGLTQTELGQMVSVSRQTICAVELECCDPSIWLAFDIAQLFDMKIEDVNRNLNLNLYSEEFNTLGGWLLEQFGYLPSVGNALIFDKVIFTAEDIAQRRIITVKVKL